MRYLSVCSGIEAATVAWHPLGWTPIAFSEIDPFACAVLQHHWPDVPLHGDFTELRGDEHGSVDVLVGGTPCQDFSVAGLRTGIAGARGNLTLEFLRLAGRLRPAWIVWENVPGVLSLNRGRAFGAVLGGLAQLGYGFAYRILDAQYFGLAQRRERVFVVGHLGDWRHAAAVLFERESLHGHPAPRPEAGEAVAPTISARPTAGGGLGTDFDCDESETFVAHSLRADGFDASEDGTGRGTPRVPVHAFDARQSDVIQYGDKTGPLDTDGHSVAVAFHENQRAEITTNDTAGSLKVGGGKPGQGYPAIRSGMQVRRLTPREFERLQGFPDDYTLIPWRKDLAPDGPRYKALGNSMAVPVMAWIGERIALVDKLSKE